MYLRRCLKMPAITCDACNMSLVGTLARYLVVYHKGIRKLSSIIYVSIKRQEQYYRTLTVRTCSGG